MTLGPYAPGNDPKLDAAIAALPELERFLPPIPFEISEREHTQKEVLRLSSKS